MSQAPRWFREAQLKERAGLNRNTDYMDIQDHANRQEAVQQALRQQDVEYQARQLPQVLQIKKDLLS